MGTTAVLVGAAALLVAAAPPPVAAAVQSIDKVPFGIVGEIRAQALALLGDPKAFTFPAGGCGGSNPG